MADEPKKETVRIVLPPRRDGQTTPGARETATINLPPKPVQKPGIPVVPPKPPGSLSAPPPPPKPPGIAPAPAAAAPVAPPPVAAPKPPLSVPPPAVPKPPAPAGVVPPKPPVAPPAPPVGIKPPVAPAPAAAAPVAPAPVAPAKPVTAPAAIKPATPAAPVIAPAPLSADAKKETAKVPPGAPTKAGMPQATVQLQKKPPATVPGKAAPSAPITVAAPAAAATGEISVVWGGASLAFSLIALLVQIWFLLG